ncbi:MAG: hypothetical protein JWM95_4292 [Gemmatimonadetes bacterium]|nr:hypothetical protein [Gemmatimonadota bacterium]
MAPIVHGWLQAGGLAVKSEFVSPWGICDLVGASLNPERVAHRLRLHQSRAVGSITRAALLLRIPDVEATRGISLARLTERLARAVPEHVVREEVERLISDRFVVLSKRGSLRRVNGWMPLHDRLVAVELKLSRIDEVLRQARRNLGFADESYVALPSSNARRVASGLQRWDSFMASGIGLLAVGTDRCEVLVRARPKPSGTDGAIQFYCVEKFWRNARYRTLATDS